MAPDSEPRSPFGEAVKAYGDGLRHAGFPGTYAGSPQPIFGRPDGDRDPEEDGHVAHVSGRPLTPEDIAARIALKRQRPAE